MAEGWFPPPNHLKKKNMSEEIPVLEVEKQPRALSMKSAVVVVVSLHVLAIFGIAYFSDIKKSNAEDKKFLLEDKSQFAGIDDTIATPTPTPSPTPTPEYKHQEPWPKATPELKTYPNTKKAIAVVKEKNSHYTKEYVVKHGDTFYSIVRRYKLNPNKLKQLNNIVDENKIIEGQKLKLM